MNDLLQTRNPGIIAHASRFENTNLSLGAVLEVYYLLQERENSTK